MNHPYLKNFNIRLIVSGIIILFTALIIHSCKKDTSLTDITDPNVKLAKAWYESAYPVNAGSKLNYQSNYAVTSNGKPIAQNLNAANNLFDFSQFIKPDWLHASSYTRFNDQVIEIPVDPAHKIATALSNTSGGVVVYKKQFSRSTFLLLNDGSSYQAYIMTIIADSAYLKNDFTKLDRNKYNKRESDFSGVVLYSTPLGKFVSSWFYENGNITKAKLSSGQTYTPIATASNHSITKSLNANPSGIAAKKNGSQIQSLNANLTQPLELEAQTWCQDWYQTVTVDGVNYGGSTYLGTVCTLTYYSSGGGGGGGDTGSGTTGTGGDGTAPGNPPAPCTVTGPQANVTNGHFAIDVAAPPDVGGGGGFPPPTSNPCTSTPPVVLNINTDSLKKHFPCAVALVINNLGECGAYGTLVQPFTTTRRPDLVWQNGTLPWNVNGAYQLGVTASSGGLSSTITLNTAMLQNSSQLLIEAAAIHETLHAYINYNMNLAAGNQANGYITTGTWLYSLDIWITVNGLPSNYSSHYQMLSDYFNLAVNALATLDNNAHTTTEYAMAMLYGLNNATDGTPTQQALLQTEYNNILASYGITTTQLNTFNIANLNAATGSKLPTNCN
ncbi:MAG TPA: hypothetical protein VGN20_19830 [Mucilaginibacter sp.]|jgi:hypothetical protein